MGQSSPAVLAVTRAIRHSLDGRNAFCAYAHGVLRRGSSSGSDRIPFLGAIDHCLQRPTLETVSCGWQRRERQVIAVDLLVGNSAGFRSPVDFDRALRVGRNDLVHT